MLAFAALLVVIVLIGAGYLAARRVPATARGPQNVRRVFQYALLYALVVVAATGIGGLLALPLQDSPDAEGVAQDLAFTVVATPLALLLSRWTRRRHRDDPEEGDSGSFVAYATLMPLTAVVAAMVNLHGLLGAAVGFGEVGSAPSYFVVWAVVWWFHWRLAHRALDDEQRTPHLLLGSLAGLVTAVVGAVSLVARSVVALVPADGVVLGETGPLGPPLAIALVGAVVWVRYWPTAAMHLPRTTAWSAYVLLVGVAGGLVTAVVAGSLLVWDTLVWLIGDPPFPEERVFDDAPVLIGSLLLGAGTWWYHRTVIAAEPSRRTEVRRVYEYLMAGIGLGATAYGVVMVLVAAVESATPGVDLGTPVLNSSLGALTLLGVGVPLWWFFWRRTERSLAADPAEAGSRTRRTYLVMLFGLASVATVVGLLVVVYFLFQDVVDGGIGADTFRSMRYAIGILVAAGAVAAYHGAILRRDRDLAPGENRPAGPRSVLLVGPAVPVVAEEVARRTGARVDLWARAGSVDGGWPVERLVESLMAHPGGDVLVLGDGDRLEVVPVDRRWRRPASG